MPLAQRLFRMRPTWAFVAYALLDTLCVGLGMGVPFFCILLGFPTGWYIARKATLDTAEIRLILRKGLLYAVLCSLFTLLAMAAVWGWTIPMLFDPGADLANFGIPMILYEPKASLIGWEVLMIILSPALQLLTTVFGSYLTLLARARRVA
jgi:hypothetical protein